MKYLDDLLNECKFPELENNHTQALQEAVIFILKKFYVQGILVSGSIIQGKANKNSDLDIYVINNRYECQRIQKFFNSVPTEIFVNPINKIKKYLEDELISGKPSTANMFATGFVILDQNQVIYKIRSRAKDMLQRSPNNNILFLQRLRYSIADTYENATDMIGIDEATAIILMSESVKMALQYYFRISEKWMPRHKDIFIELEKINPYLAKLGKDFYLNPLVSEKFKIANEIMDKTIKTKGFFEWSSDVEIYED